MHRTQYRPPVGQDGILRADWQSALAGLHTTIRKRVDNPLQVSNLPTTEAQEWIDGTRIAFNLWNAIRTEDVSQDFLLTLFLSKLSRPFTPRRATHRAPMKSLSFFYNFFMFPRVV